MRIYSKLKSFLESQRAEYLVRALDAKRCLERTGNIMAGIAYQRDRDRILEIDAELNRIEDLIGADQTIHARKAYKKAVRSNTLPFRVIEGGKSNA